MALRIGRVPGQSFLLRTAQGMIKVKLDRIDHGTARLIIDAPESVNIVREELVTNEEKARSREQERATSGRQPERTE
jgi:sRNA-binding carbon storage regulator CsrA